MGITTFLAKSLINYQSEDSFAFKLRKKRFERLKQLIDQYYQTVFALVRLVFSNLVRTKRTSPASALARPTHSDAEPARARLACRNYSKSKLRH